MNSEQQMPVNPTQKGIRVVWFKRDLRLMDHQPLARACELSSRDKRPVLLLYVFEEMLQQDPHYAPRHWRFVWQSLQDMNQQLTDKTMGVVCPGQNTGQYIWIARGNFISVLAQLHNRFAIAELYSHEETGLSNTFQRDIKVGDWCRQRGIVWQESPTGAVQRRLTHRDSWDKDWNKVMRGPQCHPDFSEIELIRPAPFEPLTHWPVPERWQTQADGFQQGGATEAQQVLQSFFDERGKDYYRSISSPSISRLACSRLSPYLAWGNWGLYSLFK